VAGVIDGGLVVGLLFALKVALEFGVETLRAEDIEQSLAGMAGDAKQSAGKLGDLFDVAAPSPFLARSFMRVTRRKILVALAALGEQWVGVAVGTGDLGADVGAEPGLLHAMWKRGAP